MRILAIETSCDETSAAITDGRRVLSNVVSTQISVHRVYGGVVPEIASRLHIESVVPVTEQALREAGMTRADVDAVAVTNRPGLIGALLVGVNFAKGLAAALDKPLIPVHHMRGHIAANYITHPELEPPFLCLTVSGGHTNLVAVRGYTEFETLARTRDDAAGEAFDKAARVLGLPYPGGAEMDKLASRGNPDAYKFTAPVVHDNPLDFSFSGIKTAVVNLAHHAEQTGETLNVPDVAASFTKTLVGVLTEHAEAALEEYGFGTLCLAGGVAANSHLRAALSAMAKRRGVRLFAPAPELCGDNAAMIGVQAAFEYADGVRGDMTLNAEATAEL